jgi:16S rRNA (uracil1498-N3)-methyltransferase
MTRRRWIADEASGDRAAITGSNAHHLARVLRAREGQQFDIAANGAVRRGVIRSVADDRVEFELHEASEVPDALPITLVLAIFKFDRMEWAIEKATELGVAIIVPVVARRTDSHLASAAAKRVERWRKIAKEASQQSRRVSEPEIADPKKLKQAIADLANVPLRIACSESEEQVSLASTLKAGENMALAIGPEGGWTEDELKLFTDSGWQSASLGQNILRAETAAIVALALASAFPQK